MCASTIMRVSIGISRETGQSNVCVSLSNAGSAICDTQASLR